MTARNPSRPPGKPRRSRTAQRRPRSPAPVVEGRPRDPDPTLWTPPRYDRVIDYEESLASDFDSIASDHPRGTALGGMLIGIALGIGLALLLGRRR